MDAKASRTAPRSDRGRLEGPAGSALRIVVVYAVVAGVWIMASDILSRQMTIDPDLLTAVAITKGALFVVVTSALLFVRIRSDFAHLQESADRLRESEQRLRSVIDFSPVPMTLSDADGNVTLANAAFVAALGYTRKDIPTVADWWPKAYPDPAYRSEVAAAWRGEMERSAHSGKVFSPLEVRIRAKDGTDRLMLVSAASIGAAASEQVVVYYDITERQEAEAEIRRSKERLEQVLRSVIALIGKVVEARDPYTQGHEEGVARIGRLIAEEMGLSSEQADGIEVAGLVHDVGKLGVPAEILTKPGTLADAEYSLIKDHSQRGYDILRDIDFDWPVADMVLQHHERMDGSGYPSGLAGEEISMSARILMVADVVEAMAAHRPYRPALGLEAAMAEITEHPEKFDPQVVAACVRLHREGRIEV